MTPPICCCPANKQAAQQPKPSAKQGNTMMSLKQRSLSLLEAFVGLSDVHLLYC